MKRPRSKRKDSADRTSLMELAVPVSERVEIEGIELIEINASCNRAFDSLPDRLSTSIAHRTRVESAKKDIRVFIQFMLRAREREKAKNKQAEKDFLRIGAIFRLVYRASSLKGLTKENLDAFGELNGVFNAWPYWRELVQSLTVRMGLPPMTVPVLKIGGAQARRVSSEESSAAPKVPKRRKAR